MNAIHRQWAEQDRVLKEAIRVSNALPSHEYVGAVFSISVADGRAHYKVTGMGEKNATIEWIPNADNYMAGILDEGGDFPAPRIRARVDMERVTYGFLKRA